MNNQSVHVEIVASKTYRTVLRAILECACRNDHVRTTILCKA